MARALFWRMKANGQIVIGISSYQEFPGKITNPFDDRHTTPADWEIYKATDGWLHCFRSKDNSSMQPLSLHAGFASLDSFVALKDSLPAAAANVDISNAVVAVTKNLFCLLLQLLLNSREQQTLREHVFVSDKQA